MPMNSKRRNVHSNKPEALAVQEGIPYVPAEFFTEFLNEVEYGEGIVTIAPSVVGLDDIGDFLAGLH